MSTNIIEVYPYPSRALSRSAIRSRRSMLKYAIWPFVKAIVTLSAIIAKELFL
jgi:hypothetical protein